MKEEFGQLIWWTLENDFTLRTAHPSLCRTPPFRSLLHGDTRLQCAGRGITIPGYQGSRGTRGRGGRGRCVYCVPLMWPKYPERITLILTTTLCYPVTSIRILVTEKISDFKIKGRVFSMNAVFGFLGSHIYCAYWAVLKSENASPQIYLIFLVCIKCCEWEIRRYLT